MIRPLSRRALKSREDRHGRMILIAATSLGLFLGWLFPLFPNAS